MRGFLKAMAWIGGILGVICGVLYYTVLDYWVVHQDDPVLEASMKPMLSPGDRVLIFRKSTPHTGNIARCTDPDQPARFVVGRVVGEEGETVSVGENVQINGRTTSSHFGCDPQNLIHPVTQEEVTLQCSVIETGATLHPTLHNHEKPEPPRVEKIEPGKVFLVSDNRHIHLDSRDFGALNASSCQSIALRLWSKEGWGDSKARMTFLW